ncbi:cysteine-rich venom protein-like [Pleurodeles waltl]|uniref:cysteine-rich venom protein-like n=1 Tax=Pleurodeles waltl TaxID=8319 RepID=UPI003709C409
MYGGGQVPNMQASGKLLVNLDTMDGRVQNAIVDLMNNLRRNVKPKAANMLKLSWNEDTAAIAEVWIRKCNFNHSPLELRTLNGTLCGALMYRANYAASWEHVIRAWHSQEDNYAYGIGQRTPYAWIAHYTQLVWAQSHEVGCQVVLCNKDFIYSCNFCPGGNDYTKISFPYESGKPCGRCPNDCDAGLCTNPCPFHDKFINCESLKEDCKYDYLVRAGCKATCKCTTEIK